MGNMKRLMVLMFMLCSGLSFAQKLVFVGSKPSNTPLMQWFSLIQKEALDRMGIGFEFKDVPAKRASIILNNGEVDGDVSRVYGYNNSFKNTVRIEEFLNIVTFSAFSTDPNIKINGWNGFEGTNYKVDYKLGVLIAEKNLGKYVAKNNIQTSPNFETGVRKLITGRADIYVGNEAEVKLALKALEKKGLKKKEVYKVGEMQVLKINAFLHKKHKELAPIISSHIKDMKEEGLFEEYRNRVGISKERLNWK